MKLISREELKQKLDRGDDFKLVMALGEWAYLAKHIPGSLHFNTIGATRGRMSEVVREEWTRDSVRSRRHLARAENR